MKSLAEQAEAYREVLAEENLSFQSYEIARQKLMQIENAQLEQANRPFQRRRFVSSEATQEEIAFVRAGALETERAKVRAKALEAAIKNAKHWTPSPEADCRPRVPTYTPPSGRYELWEKVSDEQRRRRRETRKKAQEIITSVGHERTQNEAKSDELFFSLADALRSKGIGGKTVRVALTTDERDRLASRCDIALHVVGSRGHKMWYRDEGYGFSSWLYAEPPAGRGHYLVRVRLQENDSRVHEQDPSVSLDLRYHIHMRPRFDDPYNTYLPPTESPSTPPPMYPCTTQYETQLRNVNGRPNWTPNRAAAGHAHAKMLSEMADERSEYRARTARRFQREPLIGSIVEWEG